MSKPTFRSPSNAGFVRRRRACGKVVPILLVAITAALVGVVLARQWLSPQAEYLAASIYPEARTVQAFELVDGDGQPFTEADLGGRIALVFLGFTNCPDICPDTLQVLAEAFAKLDTMRAEPMPQVLFISVDPERDGGTSMQEYAAFFDARFKALTGSDEQLQGLTRQLGAMYFRQAPDDSGFYTVDHSGMVVIIDSKGRMYGRFPQGSDADSIAADLFRLVRAGV
jgi:protein SCO1/2